MSLVTDDFAPHNVLNDRFKDIMTFDFFLKKTGKRFLSFGGLLIRWSLFTRDFYSGREIYFI